MNTDIYFILEKILFDYVCGIHTAKQVQRMLSKRGYKADLRSHSNIIDVMDVETGNYYQVEI